MKNILRVTTLALLGLALSTSIASASVYSYARGENPCRFGLKNLENHGYNKDKTYTAEGIHQLLKDTDIEAKNVDTLVPGQSYYISYSCYVDHQLARTTLKAVPVNNAAHVITNIYWSATKPTP